MSANIIIIVLGTPNFNSTLKKKKNGKTAGALDRLLFVR